MVDVRAHFEGWKQARPVQVGLHLVNFLGYAIRRFFADRLTNSAAALTYSTLLALVPLLVIAFAILSSFPAFDAVKGRMQEMFFSAVVPEAGTAVSDYLSNFTQNANNLTTVGVVALAVAALLLLSTVEDTLNQVWHVDRPRPIMVRFLIFWAILTLGPLLIGASFTLTSDLMKYVTHTQLAILGVPSEVPTKSSWIVGGLIKIAINTIGFTALFVLVPARRVRIRHALIGAIFAAVAFQFLSWGFNTFYTSGSSYETIYGAVAAVPVFLIWIYTSWMVIILGAVFAAAFPDWWQSRSMSVGQKLTPSDRLAIAIALLSRLHRNAQDGGTLDEETLAAAVPLEEREEILDQLCAAGYVVETEQGGVAITRDLHMTTVYDLIQDLGLFYSIPSQQSLGLPERIAGRMASKTRAAQALLDRVHDSETELLSVPLAQVLTLADASPVIPTIVAKTAAPERG
ncbi:YihY family inner membrane protein [Puniceibacterium confluentis]|uniref:YihY family inner membrane protein n=1 Tax=Puniceibacterium confluentis TaxID=1958944 RepID=UPI0011B70D34|nr:YihY family inner membrane protein [Puniceibacterium confluentis]